MDYEHALGETIARARRSAGLTQRELGDALGVTDRTVSNWERGRYDISVGTLARIEGITNTTGLMEAARQAGIAESQEHRRKGCYEEADVLPCPAA